MDYQKALQRLIRWAQATATVRALVLTGSAAAHLVHPLSDRDLELFVTDHDGLLRDESWWTDLGEVLVVERLDNPGWHPTRLVYYAGGKLDFTIIPATALSGRTYDRPFEVLVDKDGQAPTRAQTSPAADLPPADEFTQSLHWAYAAALMCAKAIVRDEPWSAKIRDRDLKDELLKVIEWDHRVRYGPAIDTRFLGSRMRRWMDDDVQADLQRCWVRFDLDDTAAALEATVELLARLAARTGRTLGYEPFPHSRLHTEVRAILSHTAS